MFRSGQSKLKAKQAIEAILALDTSIKSEQDAVKDLHRSFNSPSLDIVVTQEALESSRAHLKRLEKARAVKFDALDVDDSFDLVKLKSNKYLTARMNALALKHRLRDRLRQRKFEMERLERSYRRTMNGAFSYILSTVNCLRLRRNKIREAHPRCCSTPGPHHSKYC